MSATFIKKLKLASFPKARSLGRLALLICSQQFLFDFSWYVYIVDVGFCMQMT